MQTELFPHGETVTPFQLRDLVMNEKRIYLNGHLHDLVMNIRETGEMTAGQYIRLLHLSFGNIKNIKPEARVLTWKQPFLYLMQPGIDKVETRTWPTKYRGWVLIHGSKTGYRLNDILSICGPGQSQKVLELIKKHSVEMEEKAGTIQYIGYLGDSFQMSKRDEERCFVEYWNGLHCQQYFHVQAVQPFAFTGKQGWATATPEMLDQIKLIF